MKIAWRCCYGQGRLSFPPLSSKRSSSWAGCSPMSPQRRHFAEYLTGLLVAAEKERHFPSTGNLPRRPTNRVSIADVTEVDWHVAATQSPTVGVVATRGCRRATLSPGLFRLTTRWWITRGRLLRMWGTFGITPQQRHRVAHDYLIANYVWAVGEALRVGVSSVSQGRRL